MGNLTKGHGPFTLGYLKGERTWDLDLNEDVISMVCGFFKGVFRCIGFNLLLIFVLA